MKIFTTINPNGNFDAQSEAINSWLEKYDVVSVNTKDEVEILKNLYPGVEFKITDDFYLYKNKKLIKFDSILFEMGQVSGYSCFLNSDIILKKDMEIKINSRHLNNGIYLSTRYDIDGNEISFYKWGFDFFCIHSKYVNHFKNDLFAIGLPWWDYWLPICAFMNGFNLYHLDYQLFYHRKHKTNYDMKKWHSIGYDLYNQISSYLDTDELLFNSFMENEDNVMLIKKFIDSKLINLKQSNIINL